jgi:nucleosome binding factor SPN SPT16 subunit
VPFHVSTIKNVSKNEEGKHFYLRVNFLHPGAGIMKDSKYVLPELRDANNFYIKELTFRSSNPRNLNNSFKTLKELIKKVKANEVEEKEKGSLIDQEKLIMIKGKRPTLQDVTIRPNISGKKTQGSLEGHQNGVRFTSNKGDKVDIIYSNIKHAIFQPFENELIVLIHFRLRNSIMIGAKKTLDVQFYTEAGIQSDDLDMRRRSGMDIDEIQAEQRERKFKEKLNKEFKNFVESVQSVSNETIDFEIPYRDLGFHGVPHKSNVFIMPSVNCLMSLIDQPFFVVSLSEVEVVHFERVQFTLKNFDMVMVFKDYAVTPLRICSIPAEYLDQIKDWLNDTDIVYSESLNPLNWGNVMKEITKDLQGFIDEGGWDFLQESEDEGEEGSESEEMDLDSEFSAAEVDESESEESDFSDESEAEDSEEEEDEGDSDDDEEGMEWDELEEEARKMDSKKNAKYAKEVKPAAKKAKR